MSATTAVWIVLLLSMVAANLPWMSNRVFFVREPKSGHKSAWQRLLEWLLLYFIVGGIVIGLEQKITGTRHAQDWEFYAVTACLFLVFALPGFIYRTDLRVHLDRARRRSR